MPLPRVDIGLLGDSGDGYGDTFYEGKPFTGIAVEFGPAGERLDEVPYRIGKPHGPSRSWDAEGRCRMEEYYSCGILHGATREWDEQGQLVREEIWEFHLRIHERVPNADGELRGGVALLATQPSLLERWREERAHSGPQPIIELVDDEFVEVPWPFDDLLPEQLPAPARRARDLVMTDTPIPAHELDYPDSAGALEDLEDGLPIAIENIDRRPDNLGAAFDEVRQVLGFRTALKRPLPEIVNGLSSVVELGVALFQRGSEGPGVTVTLSIGGARIDVPGHNSYYNSAPRWADAVGAAMALRDQESLARLCEFDVRSFRGSYDDYLDVYAQAVIAFVTQTGDADGLFEQTAASAAKAERFPERGQRLGVPLAHLAQAVVRGDEQAFNEHLAEALGWYRTLHSRAPDKHNAGAVVPLPYLGWSARAHDRGLSCRVPSDYLPPSLVDGSFRDDA